MKAFEVDFRPLETEHDRLLKARQEEKAKENESIEDAQSLRLEQEKEFEVQRAEALEKVLKSLKPEDLEILKDEFLSQTQDSLLFKKVLESK